MFFKFSKNIHYSKLCVGRGKVPTLKNLAKIRFFVPNPFSESKKWTKINVHFWNSQNTFGKTIICDHNEKLSSQHKKNNSNFVTLIFFYLSSVLFRKLFLLSI